MTSHAQIRAPLVREYGQPQKIDTGWALRKIGKRDQIHPRNAFACIYASEEAAQAYADANLVHWGYVSLGRIPVDGGILGVTDLRQGFRDHDAPITDPALPDNWKP